VSAWRARGQLRSVQLPGGGGAGFGPGGGGAPRVGSGRSGVAVSIWARSGLVSGWLVAGAGRVVSRGRALAARAGWLRGAGAGLLAAPAEKKGRRGEREKGTGQGDQGQRRLQLREGQG
jgi:hypothetical protein